MMGVKPDMPSIYLPMLENPQGTERELGSLILSRGCEKLALPLASVDISARVINQVAQTVVKQVFRNPFSEHLEAVYIFPLAASCAVSSFDMKVGDRSIKGVVQERAEARRQYQQALTDGKRAALMEQERDDVFTVQVGNLPLGQEVTIEISYSERLPFFEDGKTELRLPLVVAPRYIPGKELARESVGDGVEFDTDLVPDASRISPPRLAKGVDPQTALKLKVEILPEDGAEISDLACSQHANKTSLSQGDITVSLARADERLNRDFVLRWRSASDTVRTSLLTYKAEDGQIYGMLSLMPPRRTGYLGAARDIVFVLDRSGSMQGKKMSSAARACAILLNTLGPNDRYAIAAFDNVVEWMPAPRGGHFIEADTAGVEKGEKYLRNIEARGGTEMDNAIRHAFDALKNRNEGDGRLPAIVILTDGEVGNESQILHRVQKEIADARLFVVGIDTAVNSGLLKRLANLGGGTAAFVEPGVQLEEALASIGREIGAPLVTDLQVENLELTVDRASLSPGRIPDIFAGRSSVTFLKLSGKGKLKVTGKTVNGKAFEEKVKAQLVDLPCIAQLWAKAQIVELEDQYRVDQYAKANLKQRIIELSVKHQLLTKFTAFVVVDEAEIVNKTGELHKVVQPVEMPDAWEMDSDAMVTGKFMALRPGYGSASPVRARKMMLCDSVGSGPADELLASSTRLKSLEKFESSAAQSAAPSCDAWGAPAPASDAWGEGDGGAAGGAWDGFSANAPSPAAKKDSVARDMNSAQPPSPPAAPQQAPAQASPPPAPQAAQRTAKEFESSGSYGMGVRDQVFEVVVRQAIAGAPWREICQGPMQVNNISEAEVEAEIARRTGRITDPSIPVPPPAPSTPAHPPIPPSAPQGLASIFSKLNEFAHSVGGRKQSKPVINAELAQLRELLKDFLASFETAFKRVKDGDSVEPADLESVRLKLLQKLAPTTLGMELQQLQRFLRATAIELIASLKDKSLPQSELQAYWQSKKEIFENLKREIDDLLSGKEAAFWDASV